MSSTKPSLRDRKRLDTRARLEDAAVSLVLRDGLEHTTIHAISERADVSPRTFFNYFACKDSAILGMRNPQLLAEHAQDFLDGSAHQDPIEAVVALLLSMFDVRATPPQIRDDRMEIIRRYPQILASQLEQITQVHGHVTQTVEVLLARHPKFARHSARDLADLAEVTLGLCGVALRTAMKDAAHDTGDIDIDHIEQRALWLVQQIARETRT